MTNPRKVPTFISINLWVSGIRISNLRAAEKVGVWSLKFDDEMMGYNMDEAILSGPRLVQEKITPLVKTKLG
jgi:hypothetical protein